MKLRSSPFRPARGKDWTRRDLLRVGGMGVAGAGAAWLTGCGDDDGGESASRLGQLETTHIVFPQTYALCAAPMYVAREYLLADGFTDVEYSVTGKLSDINQRLAVGTVDMTLNFSQPFAVSIDQGAPITILGAAHGGCYELCAREGIDGLEDLKGKTIGIIQVNPTAADYAFALSILAFVGLEKDVPLVGMDKLTLLNEFANGRLHAVLAYPPMSQLLRQVDGGHTILSSMTDRPWADYYCCMIAGNREWVAKHPEAAKRAVRAILKGADQCVREPEKTAQYLTDNGFAATYEIALDVLQTMRYDVWRSFDPEDTLRFNALRLYDAGVISSTPDQIIKRGSDWTLWEEVGDELAFAPRPGPGLPAAAFMCEVVPAAGGRSDGENRAGQSPAPRDT